MADNKKTLRQKLLDVQTEIGAIKKDSTNPYFNSKYFDINSLLAQVKPILNAHGLILAQPLGISNDGKPVLNTILMDAESKEELHYFCPLPEIVDAQKAGSAITYFRRYALQSMLALEAEDDDAEGAMGRKAKPVRKATPKVDTDRPPFGPGSAEDEMGL
jgi:hypothetical protein